MDQEQKKIFDNTSSSYLSLKAELLRKKQDHQRASSSSISSTSMLENLQSTSSSLKLKTKAELDIEIVNPSKKKKKKIDQSVGPPPSPPAATLSREDEIAFAKSRAILEAKSKLYDQIMSNNEMRLLAEDDGNEDEDKSFLVDFERKIYENNPANDKIEYTDSFGRTRLVTPEEYERLKATEQKRTSPEPRPSARSENEIERVERLHREQMRSKWEADMEELRNKTHVHYQDVLFDEKRQHGVGYYNFSTDDKQRAEQMTTLNEMRTNTKYEQSKFIYEKEKKQSNMADRLNKIRLRKAKEMGIHLEGSDINDNHPSATETNVIEPLDSSREEIPKQSPMEKRSELNTTEVIPLFKPQPSEPKLLPIPTQQPISQTSSSAFAYPFPVMRATHPSSSVQGNSDSTVLDNH